MLHGGMIWLQGKLSDAEKPLDRAMFRDGRDGRAAPWLFEVYLRQKKDTLANFVWEKAEAEFDSGMTAADGVLIEVAKKVRPN